MMLERENYWTVMIKASFSTLLGEKDITFIISESFNYIINKIMWTLISLKEGDKLPVTFLNNQRRGHWAIFLH